MVMNIEYPILVIGDHIVAPSHFVRNLGVILDSLAGMERQINATGKTSYNYELTVYIARFGVTWTHTLSYA